VPRPPWYPFPTIAGALATVNSVLIGGTCGLAVSSGTGTLAHDSAALGVPCGDIHQVTSLTSPADSHGPTAAPKPPSTAGRPE
jgi:hypothetical protein